MDVSTKNPYFTLGLLLCMFQGIVLNPKGSLAASCQKAGVRMIGARQRTVQQDYYIMVRLYVYVYIYIYVYIYMYAQAGDNCAYLLLVLAGAGGGGGGRGEGGGRGGGGTMTFCF